MVCHFQKRWHLKFRRDPDAGRVLFIGPLVLSLDVVRRSGSPHAYRSSRLREWIANRLLGLATWALPANHPASGVIWDAAWTIDNPAWMALKEAAMRKREAEKLQRMRDDLAAGERVAEELRAAIAAQERT